MNLCFIGGVPRTGKTTLAKRLAREQGASWLSTDALEAIAAAYTPDADRSSRFPKAAMRQATNYNNDEFYSTYSIEEIVASYTTQAAATAPAITALAEYAHKEAWPYLIEGYHLTPQLLASLQRELPGSRAVLLVATEPSQLIARSRTSDAASDWVRDRTEEPATYEKLMAMLTAFSQQLIEEATAHQLPCVDVSTNYEQQIDAASEHLMT